MYEYWTESANQAELDRLRCVRGSLVDECESCGLISERAKFHEHGRPLTRLPLLITERALRFENSGPHSPLIRLICPSIDNARILLIPIISYTIITLLLVALITSFAVSEIQRYNYYWTKKTNIKCCKLSYKLQSPEVKLSLANSLLVTFLALLTMRKLTKSLINLTQHCIIQI